MTAATVRIPLVDLQIQHDIVRDDVLTGWADVVQHGAFILGPEVEEFESAFATFCGVKHCIGVASGTDALELALRAQGIGQGDEVIVPANTFIASAAAIARAGATPVLVDVDPASYLLDPKLVGDAITRRTRAIMPVHLYGQLAPMGDVLRVAGDADLVVIEDAAQAQGAEHHGRGIGGFGHVAATSFYPGKNLGAYGDAGAVLTNSDAVAERVRRLRDHGTSTKYHHTSLGFNSRLDTLQAVVLSAKLSYLPEWNAQRRTAAARYGDLLSHVGGVVLPSELPGNHHVWHLYVIQVPNRDEVVARMQQAGVGVGIHYPIPVHLQGAFRHLGHGVGAFPATEDAAHEIMSLPIYPGLTAEQQTHVVSTLRDALVAP